jgi:hypothetical protein
MTICTFNMNFQSIFGIHNSFLLRTSRLNISEKMKVHGYIRAKPGGKHKTVHVKSYSRKK